jgi:hypothetical protein
VLKDIWIDDYRTREGMILTQLYNEANEEDKKLVEKHFLTTVCHGDVWIKPEVVDDTPNSLMHGLELSESTFVLQQKPQANQPHQFPSGSEGLRAPSRLHLPHPTQTYVSKTHYRVVFKEVGKTIDLVPHHHDVIRSLLDTVAGEL